MANLRADNLTGTGGRNAIDGSVFFNEGSDSLTVPAGSDFAYSTGDFTFEAYVWKSSFASDTRLIFSQSASGNNYILFGITTSGQVIVILGHSNSLTSTETIALNSWNHVAVSRSSGTVKVFVNGVASSGSSITTDLNDTTRIPTIGKYTHTNQLQWKGYISNFRIIKGTALYTANFTPPTEKLKPIDGTVLLCCQDSDNELQEATGKTITGYGNLDTTQAEKINGRWNQDPTGNGWTLHTDASASYANGQWTVTSPSTVWKGATTSFTSIVGQQYRLTALVVTSNNWGSISVSHVGGGSAAKLIHSAWHSGSTFPKTINMVFTATGTTAHISIDNLNTTNNTVTTVQYVSVKPVEVGKAPKVLPSVGIDEGVVFEGDTKVNSQSYMYFPTGDTSQRGRGRGFRFGGDSTPSKTNHIEYVNIQSQGTAQDFGDLLTTLTQAHAGSSSIRSILFAGYNAPATVSDIQYITNATQGNSIDAGINVGGDFSRYCNVVSNEVRSVYGGGTPGFTATIEYVTNASLSSVTDFGDFSAGGMYSAATMNSSTRGIFAGGYYNPGGGATKLNTIQYITIMTTGNSQDFGDLVTAIGGPHGICSSPTRGIAWDNGNTIQYLTIATTGNGVDFGDATVAGFNSGVSFSSHTRGVAGGGYHSSTNNNWIEFVTISTTGNAQDFGDLRTGGSSMGGSSDCHGGLS